MCFVIRRHNPTPTVQGVTFGYIGLILAMVLLIGCQPKGAKKEASERQVVQRYHDMQDSLAHEFASAYAAFEATLQPQPRVSSQDSPAQKPQYAQVRRREAVAATAAPTPAKPTPNAAKSVAGKPVWVGTRQALQSCGVLDREGQVLVTGGLGQGLADVVQHMVVEPPRFRFLALDSRSVTLLTTHPKRSYLLSMIDAQRTRFEILDPEAFWQHAEQLVIVLN